MEQTNPQSLNQQLQKLLSSSPGNPASEGLVGFTRRILPMLGVNPFPKDTASDIEPKLLGTPAMTETRPDETTLSGRAEARMRYEGTKQQQNLEDISFGAAPFIENDAKPDEVEEDWLANFFNKSRLVSDKEVQKLWSHLLAGEVNNPGSFSPLTLDTLSKLTKKDAILFKQLCSYVWVDENDRPATVLPFEILQNREFIGLSPTQIYHLGDIGLAKYELIDSTVMGDNVRMTYHGKMYKISMKSPLRKGASVDDFPLGHVDLTLAGRELFSICTQEPNWEYMDRIIKWWNKKGFIATEFTPH